MTAADLAGAAVFYAFGWLASIGILWAAVDLAERAARRRHRR